MIKIMVALRLQRRGSKNRPYYKIVVADKRSPRDGRYIEQIGTYDPLVEGVNWKVDLEKADQWISNGAQASDTVSDILKKARKSETKAN